MKRHLYLLLLISNVCIGQVIPSFVIPDTICVNAPVNITNTSINASTYYWNFCVADINLPPTGFNLGNVGGNLSTPVFMDYVLVNNNYYGFVTNYVPGGLVRLDFGNSLLNAPTSVNLGNFGGNLPPFAGTEGLQIVNNEGNWYIIIVGGYLPGGSTPRIVKLDFGPNILNSTPIVTNWGNLGNMLQPVDLHVFKENNNWYGLTVNAENNSITRFDFTNSFNNTPTAVNLGNIGNLLYPTGIYAIDDNGYWRVFVVNGGDKTQLSPNCSISRLDFGSSLLNTPTGVNLGNPGNVIQHPRDITIMKSCGKIVGFLVNGNPNYNDIVKLDFNGNLSVVPSAVSLGNIGNFNFPHSISKLFRINDDLYSFITNAANNTISRLKFTGCTNASVPNSNAQNPASVIYDAPGTYNINLTVDDGLPTQGAFCRQVTVVGPNPVSLGKDTGYCKKDSITIFPSSVFTNNFTWSTGATTPTITIKTAGDYWLEVTDKYGCKSRDTVTISEYNLPSVTGIPDQATICSGNSLQLTATGGNSYTWSPASGLSNTIIANPLAMPLSTTQYIVAGTGNNGCMAKDTIVVNVNPKPLIALTADTTVCIGSSIQLMASGGNTYSWLANPTLSNTAIPNPVASPIVNTTYYITVTNGQNCSNTDSVKIAIRPKPVFSISADKSVCKGSPIQLIASGGNTYSWSPANFLNNAIISNPVAIPGATTVFQVQVADSICHAAAQLSVTVTVLPGLDVHVQKSNDIDCGNLISQLTASGASSYLWTPAAGLSDPAIYNPLAKINKTTIFFVKGTDNTGCTGSDSITIKVTGGGNNPFNVPNAFTPNGDGLNDCFGISKWGAVDLTEFSIYNRFGDKVFTTRNPSACWDGNYKGKKQDPGGFIYIIRAKTFCGDIFRKGIVLLMR